MHLNEKAQWRGDYVVWRGGGGGCAVDHSGSTVVDLPRMQGFHVLLYIASSVARPTWGAHLLSGHRVYPAPLENPLSLQGSYREGIPPVQKSERLAPPLQAVYLVY